MKKSINFKIILRISILIGLLATVMLFQNIDGWGDFYAQTIYPSIAFVLSSFSNIFSFAIGDLFILLTILFLIAYPFLARKRGEKWVVILFREIEFAGWIYVWFYLAWGLNYSQSGMLEKLNIKPSQCSEEQFREFAKNYVEELNSSYDDIANGKYEIIEYKTDNTRQILMEEVVKSYHSIGSKFAINTPWLKNPKVKNMMFSPLISMFGVSGSMAPFFCEFTVNSDVLPLDYPTTYAHEMAHQLGITSEAEANFYAYQVCTNSQNPQIRFSGYNSIIRYILGNARSILGEEEYSEFYKTIDPNIIKIAQEKSRYWKEKYSPLLGKAQDIIYNAYLKSNKISGGIKNYSQVIGLLISIEENTKKRSM